MAEPLLATRGWNHAAHIPWQTPDSLDDLHGPLTGTITVPPRIDTSLNPMYDLEDLSQRFWFYIRVVRDEMPDEQSQWLDRSTLLDLWTDMILPIECRQVWENKFPELATMSR